MDTRTRITACTSRIGRGSRRAVAMLAVTAVLWTGAAGANDRQSLDEIREAVTEHARAKLAEGSNSTVEVSRVDPRLRLAPCGEPLETFEPPGRGGRSRATVGVRCHAPSPWTLYVSVRIETIKDIFVAARTIPRGTLLTESDLTRVERNVNRLTRGYFTDAEQLLGMEASRPLREGEIITAGRIDAPRLVERGQTVLITASGSGASISMSGEALQSGALGDRIRVRNNSSERVVEGEIVADSRVQVGY
ncbi:flagellar basal body P-ring formation chaperone FlgA [Aquisalimonas lutea]|uniref:flagellar basal body P-ring formation chaperone FlgA n=1 Tax=Aquisalimonas lutea TaxID=1327750 RepID=UPI0025B3FF4F|nr:flagellar basal body P-ring formation chaperone FlgA [Aquisalimonas lutea]MDN3517978.1 flagellar basal body P-ring formation chaperone FlgA [Aquisalimonas lutea]